jgi:4-aminobutyrate aminotransferase-like enzyme
MSSAYHGHLTTLVELSTYKFKKANTTMKAPEHVHVVCINKYSDLFNCLIYVIVTNS